MAGIISTIGLSVNKQWNYSSSVVKSAILDFNGIGASIFRKDTNYCINP